MHPQIKKTLIIVLSTLVILFAALAVLPFAFQGKISTIAKSQINSMLNAKVDFEKVNLSFIRRFPNVSVRLENFRIVGTGKFSKDTLLASENIDLVLNLKSLFSNQGYDIRKLQFNNSKVLVHVLPNGDDNWHIMKKDSTQPVDTSKMKFHLKLRNFVINHADIVYWDQQGNKKAVLQNFNHVTSGDMTADSSKLFTKTSVDSISFWMDNVKYLSKANAEINAEINADLNHWKFTFSKNESRLNAIPFSFAGWFQLVDQGYDMNLTVNTDKVDFKSILSLIPPLYANKFNDIKAGGKVKIGGWVKGKMTGDFYPSFKFELSAVDGWFQYPGLPKSVQNINIAADISNPGKTFDETIIDISRFSFLMGGNPFMLQLHVAYPMSDPELKLIADGKINLSNIAEIYPLQADTKLNGLLNLHINLGGRMSYYDQNAYNKFTFGGNLNISNMVLEMSLLPQKISIKSANLNFNNQYINLNNLQLSIGRNDLTASGKLENFVAYALHRKTLSGTLNIHSNYFNISDFIAPDKTQKKEASKVNSSVPKDTAKMKVIEIPKNINFSMQAGFDKLVYDQINFSNAKGILTVSNGKLMFQNLGLQAFGGNMNINGMYDTSDTQKPVVNFDMDINNVVFTEIAKQVETFRKFAPIFEKATGQFSTKLSFNSLLNNNMMPNLSTFFGNGSLTTQSIGIANVPILNALALSLKRNEISNTTLKNLALIFEIKDGKVNTKPFNLNIGDIKLNLGGSTGLDQTIAYSGVVQLPDKFHLGQFSTYNIKIGGTFTKPKIKLDLAGTVNSLLNNSKINVINQVNDAKTKAVDAARIQRDNAVKAAQAEADRIRSDAKALTDKLISEAKAKGDDLISKASNPITKKIAQIAAQKLMDEAQKKANDINAKAETQAQQVIQKAASQVNI
jgi:hypothetical protein